MKRVLSIVAVIIAAVVCYLMQIHQEDVGRKQYATRFSSKSTGTSVFYNLVQNIHPGGVHLGLQPIFDDPELNKSSVYILLEPLRTLSGKEIEIIANFVRRGGTAIFSYRDIRQQNLGYELVGDVRIRENRSFKNYQPTDVNVSYAESSFFPEGRYAFYSNFVFDTPECNDRSLACFVNIHSYGKGHVLLFSGVPILANGLIGMADNRLFAYKLVDETITLDEYHHNYKAKSYMDLLLTPSASLPILGAILIGILFFMFGRNSLNDEYQEEEKHITAHDLRLGILQNVLTRGKLGYGVVLKLASYVEKLCPTKKQEIDEILNDLNPRTAISRCQSLTAIHKKFLLERGE